MANTSAASVGGSGKEPSMTASAIVAHSVGSHILRIDGYSHTKGLGNGKCISSEKFIIGGRRWYLQYYPDGSKSSSSDWIYVFLRNDGADEVKAKFTFSLLDQDGNIVSSYSRSSPTQHTFSGNGGDGTNASWGYPAFIRSSDLEASVYLKDDVFSIKCDVTVSAKEISTKAIPVPPVRRGA